MTTSGKIRVLLGLLFASLLFTAVIVQNTYTPLNSLHQTAKILEDNLHKKESWVNETLNDKTAFNQLKSLPDDHQNALSYIQNFTTNKSIWFITLNNGALSFWSGIKIIPQNAAHIKEGYSFIRQPNGYYEAIRKSDGAFSVIFFIPVKIDYAFQNQYLQNAFAKDLIKERTLEIADFTDAAVYPIRSVSGPYLFSVKLKAGDVNHRFFYYEIVCWLLAALSLCILIQNVCSYIANRGHVVLSVFLLAALILLARGSSLIWHLPNFSHRIDIFNPAVYSAGFINRSLGDFCINVLAACWFVYFLYKQRLRLIREAPGKAVGYCIFIGCILLLIGSSTILANLFYGLVVNSNIEFNVNNILNLSALSMLGVLILCFAFLLFYMLIEIFVGVTMLLNIPQRVKSVIFIASILLATALATIYHQFTLFYILWAVMVVIRFYAYLRHGGKLSSLSFSFIILICALISSIKLNHFESDKEKEVRKTLVKKLVVADDATADILFKAIEKNILKDTAIIRSFKDTLQNDFLRNRFQKLYFDGYLAKYDFKVHIFNSQGHSLSPDKNYSLDVFKEMVLYSSFKVSDYFYRANGSFGFQNYFALLPITHNQQQIGTIAIELKAKPLLLSASFPDLLTDGVASAEDEFKDYSYAFYYDGKLMSQNGNGSYIYNLTNTEFEGKLNQYVFTTSHRAGAKWYLGFSAYSHLIYMPSPRNLVVISKEENILFYGITSITFFFVIMLMFSLMLVMVRWLWLRLRILTISDNKIKWSFRLRFDSILYRTRIQFSMVLAVVITLVMVGFITFLSISSQYNKQQEKIIRDKVTLIASAFENGSFYKYLTDYNEKSQVEFSQFASANGVDLILFDHSGVPIFTTQPKIYEDGLQARRMNARAFIYLNKLQKSEYVNDEVIGNLNYKAAYSALRNSKGETVAYLQLPYFSNENDYKERIGSLINVMINVYALVFIAIGLFAVIIARQITAPLNFIQYSLSKTIYGKKNEPIQWDRDDEIGALVKEYNKMISELETSAQRLAQSERESAWREMAKQVAHEIKNPLTPLKLGLQLLDKSWKDKDPKFDQKFERFSKSFVEQIESLSSIASEFSAFAKMPDTRLELINIFDMLNQAVIIFKQMDNVQIVYQAPESPFYINADRDQLLRCFNNLLKNAIEATPPERSGLIEINYLVTNKNILLTLKDNGNGIPEHMREKIFEPNFTTKSSGTGLGLAFVKNSIENAGGKVWFETILGTGTTFYFSLPAG